MPKNEPTNEQLREWREKAKAGRWQYVRHHCEVIDALLAAREEIAALIDERNLQIAALQIRLKDAERDYDDMRRFQAKFIQADQERYSLRGELEAARESYRRLEPCGHPGNFQMGDEHGHFTCVVCERDAARAGEARLREALTALFADHKNLYEQLADDDPEPDSTAALCERCEDALSSTADSAKWLEERIIKAHSDAQAHTAAAVRDAEQRGYERGKAEGHAERCEKP